MVSIWPLAALTNEAAPALTSADSARSRAEEVGFEASASLVHRPTS